MATINPKKLAGRWVDGYALDLHTRYSVPMGEDEYGHPRFDTKRTEMGELLYRLKYASDQTVIGEIVERLRTLEGAHAIDPLPVAGKSVLLFDDLYRSGATMNAIAALLLDTGKAAKVIALTLTKTRSRQ